MMTADGAELDRAGPAFSPASLCRHRRISVTVAFFIAAVLFFGLLTEGTFDPEFEANKEAQARFYDGEARAILHGRLDVSPAAIDGEAFLIHGRRYGYFGVVPAILRLPVMALSPNGYPNVTTWSYLGAFLEEAAAVLGDNLPGQYS